VWFIATTPNVCTQDSWIEEMSDKACVEKDNKVTFSCRYSNPNAKLRWFKNHLEIFHGHKYNFDVDDEGTLRLVIFRVSLEDAGRYTCQTDDKETSAWLTVEGLCRVSLSDHLC